MTRCCQKCGAPLVRVYQSKPVYSTNVPNLTFYTINSYKCSNAWLPGLLTTHDYVTDITQETAEYKAYKTDYDKKHRMPLPNAPTIYRRGL